MIERECVRVEGAVELAIRIAPKGGEERIQIRLPGTALGGSQSGCVPQVGQFPLACLVGPAYTSRRCTNDQIYLQLRAHPRQRSQNMRFKSPLAAHAASTIEHSSVTTSGGQPAWK